MKNIVIVFLLCTMYLVSNAQKDAINETKIEKASYGCGYSKTSLLDNSVSVNKYRSYNIPFQFRYSIEKEKLLFEYDFNGIVGFNFEPVISEINHSTQEGVLSSTWLFQQQASVRYLLRVHKFFSGKLDLQMGGEIREQFFISFAESPTFTFAELDLNFTTLLTYHFNNEHSIKTYLTWPLIGTRVNYPNANVHEIIENGIDSPFSSPMHSLVLPWNTNCTNISVEYIWQLSYMWSFGVELGVYSYLFDRGPKVDFSYNSLVLKLINRL